MPFICLEDNITLKMKHKCIDMIFFCKVLSYAMEFQQNKGHLKLNYNKFIKIKVN